VAGERSREVIAGYHEPALFDTGIPHFARVYDYLWVPKTYATR
jgi:hypothetical protein